jgi:hypothetical protein
MELWKYLEHYYVSGRSLLSSYQFARISILEYEFFGLIFDRFTSGHKDILFTSHSQKEMGIHGHPIGSQTLSNGGQVGLLESRAKIELSDSQADDLTGRLRWEPCTAVDY